MIFGLAVLSLPLVFSAGIYNHIHIGSLLYFHCALFCAIFWIYIEHHFCEFSTVVLLRRVLMEHNALPM